MTLATMLTAIGSLMVGYVGNNPVDVEDRCERSSATGRLWRVERSA